MWSTISALRLGVSLAIGTLVFGLAAHGQQATSQAGKRSQPGRTPLRPVQRSAEELLVLELRLGSLVLSDGFIGYLHRGGVLLSLDEVARALEFPITVEPEASQADGWFLRENRRFSLDLARGEVLIEGQAEPFDPSLVELHRDGIYVDATLLTRWFPVDFEFDLPRLLISVTSREPLPVQVRLEREERYARLERGRTARPVFPRMDTPYRLWDWPFIDTTSGFGYRSGKSGGGEVQNSSLISGDFLYMNSALFLAGGNENSLTDLRLTLGRKEPDGTLLGLLQAREFSFGDIFTPQIPLISRSRAGRGVEISNFPLSRPSEFDRTTLHGELPLGWEVELYRNEVLLDFQRSRPDGRYEFTDVPLLFGLNVLRLVFHGPQGQRREELQRMFVGPGLVRPGDQYYRIAASQQDKDLFRVGEHRSQDKLAGKGRFFAEYERGIGRRFSVAGSLASLPLRQGQQNYTSLGLRAAILGAFLRLDMSRNHNGGTALQLAAQTNLFGLNLLAEHGQFSDFISERVQQVSDSLEGRTSLRLDGVIPGRVLPRIPFSVTADLERRQSGRSRADISNRLSMFLHGVSISNTLDWSLSRGGRVESTIRTNGSLLVSGGLKSLSLHGQLSYRLRPQQEFTNLTLTGDYDIARDFNPRFTVKRQLSGDGGTNYSAGLNRRLQTLALGLIATYEHPGSFSIGVSISFGLGWEPRSKRWLMQADRMATNGAASAEVFLDHNQNGRFDAGDEPLQGVRFRRAGGPTAQVETDEEGVAFIPSLPSYRPTPVTLDVGSLEDPYWIPTREGVEVVPRPGKLVLLEFAVTTTGEVDGTVYLRRGESLGGVSNVELQLVNTQGEVVQKVKTTFDGFYLFTLVPPGRYRLRVSSDQIQRLNLVPPPEHEVVIEGSGTIVSGQDFNLERPSSGR